MNAEPNTASRLTGSEAIRPVLRLAYMKLYIAMAERMAMTKANITEGKPTMPSSSSRVRFRKYVPLMLLIRTTTGRMMNHTAK